MEERLSGTVDRQYVWGVRYVDDLVLRDLSTGGGTLNERMYALQDANWNVVAAYNTSTSAVAERYAYSAYGVCLFLSATYGSLSGSAFDWTVLYTGRVLDDQSELYYYRMRYYHPGLGVFANRDPIPQNGGAQSRYCYVDGNPATHIDPTGELKVTVVKNKLKGDCGGASSISWNFELAKPAPTDGYFVQEINSYCDVNEDCRYQETHPCPTKFPGKAFATYWEAFFVKSGQTITVDLQGKPPYTDISNVPIPDDTCAARKFTGTIKFFPLKTTGDLGRDGKKGTAAGWDINQKYPAGQSVRTVYCVSGQFTLNRQRTDLVGRQKDPAHRGAGNSLP